MKKLEEIIKICQEGHDKAMNQALHAEGVMKNDWQEKALAFTSIANQMKKVLHGGLTGDDLDNCLFQYFNGNKFKKQMNRISFYKERYETIIKLANEVAWWRD